MIEQGDFITYNADDEEPKCDRCDNADMSCKWCESNCGAKHWWSGYKRTERCEDD